MVRSVEHIKFESRCKFSGKFSEKLDEIDAEIETLLSSCSMPSDFIELDYQARPSFLESLSFYGDLHDLTLIRPKHIVELAGLGIRSVRSAYLNGKPSKVGYLHHLRLLPEIRGGPYMIRGYRKFREVFAQSNVPVTLTSVLEDNFDARKLLEANREGTTMPQYEKVSRFLTALIPLNGPSKRWPIIHRERSYNEYIQTRLLNTDDITQLVTLFQTSGKANDGVLHIDKTTFNQNNSNVLRGLKITDFMGVFYKNELVGATGIWNQQSWKQIVIGKLCKTLDCTRLLWDMGKYIWGKCPIPAVGDQVNSILIDPWVLKPGKEKHVMPILLKEATKEAKNRGASFAAWGVAEKHPASTAIKGLVYIPYWSIIYKVFWPENNTYMFGKKQLQLTNLGSL